MNYAKFDSCDQQQFWEYRIMRLGLGSVQQEAELKKHQPDALFVILSANFQRLDALEEFASL